MPMGQADHGSNADGTYNPDYCHYCYNEGEFTEDLTLEEMIEHCAQFAESFHTADGRTFSREEAIEQMRQYFPKLKRWA